MATFAIVTKRKKEKKKSPPPWANSSRLAFMP
jgi:hypothetical protein